jgi:hypothetical protein
VCCVCFHMHTFAPTGTTGKKGLFPFNASLYFLRHFLISFGPSPAKLDS